MRARLAVVALLALVLAGCGGGGAARSGTPGGGSPARGRATGPQLEALRPCRGARGFTCGTLSVPLDRRGGRPGRLTLRVGMASPTRAPRGVLVMLTGGPGQPGVPFLPRIRSRLGAALRGYRLVMFDQRGTGAGALRCPQLQRAMGSSDLSAPPAGAVSACAARLGSRRAFYSTTDTVADLEDLRSALGAERLTLDGVSYGTYTAERYALAHPDRVSRLVLDSVVPHDGADPLELENMRAAGSVLREACRAQRCATDPAADLAAVVRASHDGPQLLDTLVSLSVGEPSFRGVPSLLHAARRGRTQGLDRLVRAVARAVRATPAATLSQGLHASTLCADTPMPWGGPETASAERGAALRAAAARLPARIGPFDRATAAGNGMVRTCLLWPRTPAPPLPPQGRDLPAVPVLLLGGTRDLSTPLAWTRAEAARTPRGRLVVVRGSGHGVQLRARTPAGRRAVARFLAR
jgi:pimeloyl-ACP methyl ester carboxylesterase